MTSILLDFKLHKLLFSISILLFLLSCHNQDGPQLSTNPSADYPNAVMISYDDSLLYSGKTIPYVSPPFFTGHIRAAKQKQKNYLILSPYRPKAEQIAAIPIAEIDLRIKDKEESYILANALVNEKPYLNCINYEEFAVRYSSIKQIIDLWLNNYQGLGQTKVERWTPTQHKE